MANVLYTKGKQGLLDRTISWPDDDFKIVLVDTGLYTPNLTTNMFLSEIPLAARISISGTLINKTSVNGVADADDVFYISVTGATVEAAVLFKDTGSVGTSKLLAYIDTATNLPFAPDGNSVTLVMNASGIFSL